MLLYDRWLQIASQRGNELALRDISAGRTWTFKQLAAEVENAVLSVPPVVFAEGYGAGFILGTLAAWRAGALLCPLEAGQSKPDFSSRPPKHIVHLKTTSATTGAPRFVAFRPEQLEADARNIVLTMGLRPDWPNLGVISLAHSYGFSNLVLPLLLHGIPLHLAGSGLPETIRSAAASVAACTLPAVPALWRAWHDANSIPPNVKLALSAGAALPVSLEAGVFSRYGLKIHNFYGSSECGGIAYDSSDQPRSDPACAGSPMRGVGVAVAPDGCIEVCGPAVGETYWPERESSLGGGVFRTSDRGELREGLVYLHGRATEVINVAGRKVPPETIERVLLSSPQVRSVVVFGVPAAELERGERIVACLSLAPGAGLVELKRLAAEKLPAWQLPRDWWIVDDLAQSARGKISRAEWRGKYLRRGECRDARSG